MAGSHRKNKVPAVPEDVIAELKIVQSSPDSTKRPEAEVTGARKDRLPLRKQYGGPLIKKCVPHRVRKITGGCRCPVFCLLIP